MDLASSGDTILVNEATYTDNVDCLGEAAVVCVFQKELTILGGFSSGNWSLPSPSVNLTVIDGQNTRRGVIVRRGGPDDQLPPASLRMEGFTIEKGRGEGAPNGFGGGLKANFADVVLRDMVFENNVAVGGTDGLAGGGGAALLSDEDNTTSVTLERVVFRNNQATGGGGGTGGAALGGGLLVDFAVVDGLSLEFENNAVTGGASASAGRDALGGAAAFSFGTLVTLQAVDAGSNTASGGSASNTAGSAFGGGLFFEGAESPAARVTSTTIQDSELVGNTARGGDASTAGGGVGGGIATFGAQLTLDRSLVIGNRGEGGMGDTTAGNAGGGGVFLEWPFSSTPPINVVRNSILAENVIDGSQGGGAGLRLLASDAVVTHVTLADNQLLGAGFGLGILVGPRLSEDSELTLAYSILADHTVPTSGRAIHVQATASAGSTADLTDPNHFVGNSNDTNEGRPNSGTYLGFPGSNILDPNPSTFFVDAASSNYHVDGTQPPTNAAGGSSETFDVDGATRNGTRDMGADEFGALAFGLSVGKIGVGSGTVTSTPTGINCGADCFESFHQNTNVTLTPSPAAGSSFTGWSGDADCSDGSVTMTQDLECTAQFEESGAPAQCSAAEDNLVLPDQTVNTTTAETACDSITAGPYTVGPSGDVTFEAPTLILRNGFAVQGQFTGINSIP